MWACVLRLQRRAGPPATGDPRVQVHAAFLRWLEAEDPRLSEELHRPNAVRPFTLSAWAPERGLSGDVVDLRCTILDRRLFDVFARRCVHGDEAGWTVRQGQYDLGRVTFVAADDDWAGWTTFASLLDAASDDPVIGVQFATPTAFSLGERPSPTGEQRKQVELFPRPRLVWESWARKWNSFAPEELRVEHARVGELAAGGLVAAYQLRTATIDLGRYPQKGFAGWTRYEFRGIERADMQLLHALAGFAFYAGTGYKTVLGMGQTRSDR